MVVSSASKASGALNDIMHFPPLKDLFEEFCRKALCSEVTCSPEYCARYTSPSTQKSMHIQGVFLAFSVEHATRLTKEVQTMDVVYRVNRVTYETSKKMRARSFTRKNRSTCWGGAKFTPNSHDQFLTQLRGCQ